jgi:hypothetical protein
MRKRFIGGAAHSDKSAAMEAEEDEDDDRPRGKIYITKAGA